MHITAAPVEAPNWTRTVLFTFLLGNSNIMIFFFLITIFYPHSTPQFIVLQKQDNEEKNDETLDTPELVDDILGAVRGAAATTPLPAFQPRPPPSEL